MNEKHSIKINRLPTGVPGLDTVLGGGLPEYSFNLIAGEPGAGKTTLAQHIRFTSDKVSFITDAIVVQRYVEIRGALRRVLAVVKMRGSDHSHDFRTYEITAKGAVVGGRLRDYHGILTGIPELRTRVAPPLPSGLTDREAAVLDLLIDFDGTSREILLARAGLPPEELAAVLERLVAQGYATATTHEGQSVYKARAQLGE